MSKGNPFLALRLPRDEQDALRARAVESGTTVSDLVRQAIAEYLAGRESPPAPPDVQVRRRTTSRPTCSPRISRPARLQHALSEVEDLLAHYEGWQTRLPESLQDTATAEVLAEAIDNLQQAAESLAAVTLPRGFGRD